jgi:hypothetical protein
MVPAAAGHHSPGMSQSHIGRRFLRGVAVASVTASVGVVASPAQALPPPAACVYVLRMHDVSVQRAHAAAHVTAPSMIWAATGSVGWQEASWYHYWESMRAAEDWTDIAAQLGC